jgi:photosystem II stability/assembly factor-like uncharacterized protein
LPQDPIFSHALITSLTVTPAGLIATGQVLDSTGRNQEGAIWLTEDGRTWRRLRAPGFENAVVQQVARGPGGRYLALGAECSRAELPCPGVAFPRLRFWASDDGLQWTAVEPDRKQTGYIKLFGVEQRWIAFGRETEGGPTVVWTSVDGRTWTRDVIEATEAAVNGLHALPDRLVAIGTSYAKPWPDWQTVLWTSNDGTKWSRVPRNLAPRGMEGAALAFKDGVLIAFAGMGQQIWSSHDGTRWRLRSRGMAPIEGLSENDLFSIKVIDAGEHLVAVGWDREHVCGCGAFGVWISSDGVEWEAADQSAFGQPFPDGPFANDIAAFGEEVLIVGGEGHCTIDGTTMTCPDPTFWVSPPR